MHLFYETNQKHSSVWGGVSGLLNSVWAWPTTHVYSVSWQYNMIAVAFLDLNRTEWHICTHQLEPLGKKGIL